MERIKKFVPFDEILKEFARLYIQDYGVVQFKEITSKVHSSPTVKKFLIETNTAKRKPLRDDILGVIHSILYFTFAKAEKISLGSAILLSKWHQEVAIPNGLNENLHLNETLFDIIDKCSGFKINISNSETFFSKFLKETKTKFKDSEGPIFKPDNAFAEIAYRATENQIQSQGLKHSIGKLDCYIFYSTYISLLTSYLKLSNADNIDIYLTRGIESYRKFLKIDEDLFYLEFNEYLTSRSNIFVKCIQVIGQVDFAKPSNLPHYISLFETDTPTELSEIDEVNPQSLVKHFELIKTNLKWIDTEYDKFKNRASDFKLEPWKESKVSLIETAPNFIENLAILPFEEYRCQICGNFELRENLEKLKVHDEDGARLLPICLNCKAKHMRPNGWIEIG